MYLMLKDLESETTKKVEVNVRDIVRMDVHDIGVLVGTVEAVSQDYISLRNIVLIKPIIPEMVLTLKKPIIFYNNEILNVTVIGKKCDVTPLRAAN
jgi:hypothetical protein